MQLQQLPNEFIQAKEVLTTLETAGYEAYFVGGSVRDIVLQHEINDVDIATSAYPLEIKEVFPSTIDVGIEHGTVLVLAANGQYEVTTFRTESKYTDYRRPDKVTFVRSLKEDLKRRDFQMNALAMTKDGQIIDLFNGIEDIQQQVICAVGNPYERFNEDALRMMRALRFASQLDFEIEEQTYQAICDEHQLLQHISIERILQEWTKLIEGQNPTKGITFLLNTGCYQSCPGFAEHAKELQQLALTLQKTITRAQAWLLMAYYFGYSVKDVTRWLRAWKCSNQEIKLISSSIDYLNKRMQRDFTVHELYELGVERITLIEQVLPFLAQKSQLEANLKRYQDLPIHNLQDLQINGQQLMKSLQKPAGQWIGQFLNLAKEQILAQNWSNEADFLLLKAQEFLNQVGE